MFTGIITDIGKVVAVDKTGGDIRFGIQTKLDMNAMAIGASVACSGCCLTVVEKKAMYFLSMSRQKPCPKQIYRNGRTARPLI